MDDDIIKVYTRCGNEKHLVNESEMKLFLSNDISVKGLFSGCHVNK